MHHMQLAGLGDRVLCFC